MHHCTKNQYFAICSIFPWLHTHQIQADTNLHPEASAVTSLYKDCIGHPATPSYAKVSQTYDCSPNAVLGSLSPYHCIKNVLVSSPGREKLQYTQADISCCGCSQPCVLVGALPRLGHPAASSGQGASYGTDQASARHPPHHAPHCRGTPLHHQPPSKFCCKLCQLPAGTTSFSKINTAPLSTPQMLFRMHCYRYCQTCSPQFPAISRNAVPYSV